MALESKLQINDMARRKRSISPAVMLRNTEEPNRKLMCLRNMDIGSEPNQGPKTRVQINGVLKKQSKDITKGKGRKLLKMNFDLLKLDMEPIQVVDYLKENGVVDNNLHRRTVDGNRRSQRVETLITGLNSIMNDKNEDEIFAKIIDALVQSRQTQLARELQKEPESFHTGETGLEEENERLLHFFTETKENLRKELEPQKVAKEIFDLQGLDFAEYEEIINEPQREISVDILFKALESRREREWQILRPVYNWYRQNSSECESKETAETATSSSHESTKVKVSYEPVIAQDSSEHSDPYTRLRELQQCVVENSNENEGWIELDRSMMHHCTSRLHNITFSSINLHIQPLTDESLQKLIDCCKGKEVKQWIISILSEDDLKTLKELKATTFTVKVFVEDLHRENKYKLFDEETEGCLCMVSKDCMKHNQEVFTGAIGGLVMKVTNSLLEHAKLKDDLEDVLHTIRQTEELVDFLCNQNIPQVSYCFIENDVFKNERRDFIGQLRQGSSNTRDAFRMLHISNSDIKEHRGLLEEELDANWFVGSLQTRGDKASKDMVKIIENSSSRGERTRHFVEFLCKVDDKEFPWLADILQQKHPFLLKILLPEILKNVAEMRRGLLSLYDYLIKELDPEDFSCLLKASSLVKLQCSQLPHLRNKRERSVRFLSNLLKKENTNLIPEVVNAMKTYKGDIYNTVQQVLEKGSLDEHYRCPWIEKESLKSSRCCFETKISLTEDDKEGLIRTVNQNSTADILRKHIAVKETEVPEALNSTHKMGEPSKIGHQCSSSKQSSVPCSDPDSRTYLQSNGTESVTETTHERGIRNRKIPQLLPRNSTAIFRQDKTIYSRRLPFNASTGMPYKIPQTINYGPPQSNPTGKRSCFGSAQGDFDRYRYNPPMYRELLMHQQLNLHERCDPHKPLQKLRTSNQYRTFDNRTWTNICTENEIPQTKRNIFNDSFLHNQKKTEIEPLILYGEKSRSTVAPLRHMWNQGPLGPPMCFGPTPSSEACWHDIPAHRSKHKGELRQKWNFSPEEPIPEMNFRQDSYDKILFQPYGRVESEHLSRKRCSTKSLGTPSRPDPYRCRQLFEQQGYKDKNMSALSHSELNRKTLLPLPKSPYEGFEYGTMATHREYPVMSEHFPKPVEYKKFEMGTRTFQKTTEMHLSRLTQLPQI